MDYKGTVCKIIKVYRKNSVNIFLKFKGIAILIPFLDLVQLCLSAYC